MESVVVIDRKVISLTDLTAGLESSFDIPDDAASVTLLRSENGQHIEVEFIKPSCECRRRERVLRNVSVEQSKSEGMEFIGRGFIDG